jgi:peptide methionine sulfoxide reductase MsrB
MCAVPRPETGGPIVKGEEMLMSPKQHGTSAMPAQKDLRWDVSSELADEICNHNRNGAEPSGYFARRRSFIDSLHTDDEPTIFYDSVSGEPCFVAPIGRSLEEFVAESQRHGWPSFRLQEVVWANVRVLDDFEVVTTGGAHLGHQMVDSDVRTPRFCINLCSVAGCARSRVEAAWPVLHTIAAGGVWRGRMHYASGGAEGLSAAPFVIEGATMSVCVSGARCEITSSATLPNGVERSVTMVGELSDESGSVARLERLDESAGGREGGAGSRGSGATPISLLVSEHAEANTLLLQEVNATSGTTVLTSTITLLGDGELLQTSHELTRSDGGVGGCQLWRMRSASHSTATSGSGGLDLGHDRGRSGKSGQDVEGDSAQRLEQRQTPSQIEHDEEAFMYSGCQL